MTEVSRPNTSVTEPVWPEFGLRVIRRPPSNPRSGDVYLALGHVRVSGRRRRQFPNVTLVLACHGGCCVRALLHKSTMTLLPSDSPPLTRPRHRRNRRLTRTSFAAPTQYLVTPPSAPSSQATVPLNLSPSSFLAKPCRLSLPEPLWRRIRASLPSS